MGKIPRRYTTKMKLSVTIKRLQELFHNLRQKSEEAFAQDARGVNK